jgi:NADH dehydrogenase
MGVSMSGFFAMAMKHLVNLHYLFGVAGINAVWEYLQHEFFTMKNHRSFIGGHLAWRIPVYWALPLRLWLGGKWFYEGVKKIGEGWLNPGAGGLSDVDPAAINMPGVSFGEEGDAGSGASPEWEGESEGGGNGGGAEGGDGGSGASPEWEGEDSGLFDGLDGAGDSAGEVADGANSLIHTVQADGGSSASPAWEGGEGAAEGAAQAAEQASQWAEPLIPAIGPYIWFAENILSASPLLAFLLQSGVVLAEVAIGLALVGGLFTFLAAGVSLILALMFIASGWGAPELLWYIFASLVMLGGAGRGLGLDHWVMPALKRWWNRRSVAHKLYLYTGEPRIKN